MSVYSCIYIEGNLEGNILKFCLPGNRIMNYLYFLHFIDFVQWTYIIFMKEKNAYVNLVDLA